MTGRPAERYRFCVFEGAVTSERAHEDENHAEGDEAEERSSAVRIVEVNSGKLCDLAGREPPPAATFPQHSGANYGQTQDQAGRKKHVREYSQISGISIPE